MFCDDINDVAILFSENKPVVPFCPNNAEKSNILSVIDRLIGEKHPSYIDIPESDYYTRDWDACPRTSIAAHFTDAY